MEGFSVATVLLLALSVTVSGKLPCTHPLRAKAQFELLFRHCNQLSDLSSSQNNRGLVQDDSLVESTVGEEGFALNMR